MRGIVIWTKIAYLYFFAFLKNDLLSYKQKQHSLEMSSYDVYTIL